MSKVFRDVPDMPVLNSADAVVDGKAKGAAFQQNRSAAPPPKCGFAGVLILSTTAYRKDVGYWRDYKKLEV